MRLEAVKSRGSIAQAHKGNKPHSERPRADCHLQFAGALSRGLGFGAEFQVAD
jgi:hypothetical protein